jgi:hypothetical protein
MARNPFVPLGITALVRCFRQTKFAQIPHGPRNLPALAEEQRGAASGFDCSLAILVSVAREDFRQIEVPGAEDRVLTVYQDPQHKGNNGHSKHQASHREPHAAQAQGSVLHESRLEGLFFNWGLT